MTDVNTKLAEYIINNINHINIMQRKKILNLIADDIDNNLIIDSADGCRINIIHLKENIINRIVDIIVESLSV